MLLEKVREEIYVLFDVVCIHLIQNEYILAVKGYFGDIFWAFEFRLIYG
jgi:hypothetical protein